MSLNSKLKSFISSRLYYSQPVYVPGYRYSPWKKWIVIGATLLLLGLLATPFLTHQSNITSTDINTEQTSTETQKPVDDTPRDAVPNPEDITSLEAKPALEPHCDSNYSPCVPMSTADLDCINIGFSVRVLESDPHGFDRDGNGHGCESY